MAKTINKSRKRATTKRLRELRELIVHAWVHSGYKNCGYRYMTIDQRRLFKTIIDSSVRESEKQIRQPKR